MVTEGDLLFWLNDAKIKGETSLVTIRSSEYIESLTPRLKELGYSIKELAKEIYKITW